MVQTASIVAIDDQTCFLDAFGLALSITTDLELVGRAPDAPSGVDVCLALEPALVVCDYRLPDSMTATHVVNSLRDTGLDAPVLILTGFYAPQVHREAAQLHAVESVSKDRPITEIVGAVRAILRGAPVPESESRTDDPLRLPPLSDGEIEVLEHFNQGLTAADVAISLHLSLHTIRARTKQLYRKLDVTSQGEAVAKATRMGLLVPPR